MHQTAVNVSINTVRGNVVMGVGVAGVASATTGPTEAAVVRAGVGATALAGPASWVGADRRIAITNTDTNTAATPTFFMFRSLLESSYSSNRPSVALYGRSGTRPLLDCARSARFRKRRQVRGRTERGVVPRGTDRSARTGSGHILGFSFGHSVSRATA